MAISDALNDVLLSTRIPRIILNFAFHSTALWMFVDTSRRILKAPSKDITQLLKLFVLYWTLDNAISLPICIFDLVVEFKVAWTWWSWEQVSPYWFWMMSTERSFSVGIPISVFFLTLDRCLTLGLSVSYRQVHQKLMLACFVLVTMLAVVFTDFLYIAKNFVKSDAEHSKDCWKTLCFLPEPDDWQFAVRVSFGLLNLICSAVFVVLIRRQNAMRALWSNGAGSKHAGNSFVASAIISELLFNSLPHAACLIYEIVTATNMAPVFGSVSYTLNSIDCFFCALMYRRV